MTRLFGKTGLRCSIIVYSWQYSNITLKKYILPIAKGLSICLIIRILLPEVSASNFQDETSISNQDSLVLLIRKQKETDTKVARTTLELLKEKYGSRSKDQALLDLLTGEILLAENRIDEGLDKIEESHLQFEKASNKPGQAMVYDALTKYNLRAANYPEALICAFKSIEIREETDDVFGLAQNFIDVADIYWYYQRFNESIDYGLKAVQLVEKNGPSLQLAAAYKMLSESYLEIQDYDLALDYIDRSIDIKQTLGVSPLELASSINSRGNIYKFMDRYDEALTDYTQVLDVCESAGHQIGMRASMANLGHVHLIKKEYAKAIPYKLRALEIQEKTGQIQQVAENLLHLSEAYAGLEDYNTAYSYRVKLDSVKSVEHGQALDELSNEMGVKYETEKKEEAIVSLSNRVRLQTISLILGALLLMIMFIAALVFRKLNRKLKFRNNEKEILLKEIHHRVKNNLQILSSLLSLQSDHLVDVNARDAITEGKNRVESMSMIHQRLYNKRDITSVNLKEYVSELARYLEDAFSGSGKEIRIQEEINYAKMDVDYAIPLGLIINELVTNSVKYAFSGLDKGIISLRLWPEDNKLNLQVSDNGQGVVSLSANEISTSFGSMLISTLSRKLKGEISIDLQSGYSTTIKFGRFENK